MIKTIKNFTPPPEASPYNPAKTVNVPANDSVDLTLKGRSSDVFGVNRILPYTKDMLGITVRAMLNNERLIFDDINLAVLRQQFLYSTLLAPYIIQRNNNLNFTLTNNTATARDVNLELLGYDGPSLRKLVQTYQTAGLAMPTPVFLYARQTIMAGASNVIVSIPTKPKDLVMSRAFIRTGSDDDINVSLQMVNETIKNNVFVRQFNDEFELQRANVPIEINANKPFSLKVNNASAADQSLSFLGEAYVKPPEG